MSKPTADQIDEAARRVLAQAADHIETWQATDYWKRHDRDRIFAVIGGFAQAAATELGEHPGTYSVTLDRIHERVDARIGRGFNGQEGYPAGRAIHFTRGENRGDLLRRAAA